MAVLVVFLMFAFMIGVIIGAFGTVKYIRHKENQLLLKSLNDSEKNTKE